MRAGLVSPLVVYLASDLSKDQTGNTFFVGGGRIAEMKVVTHTGVTKTEDGGLWTPQEIAEKMKPGRDPPARVDPPHRRARAADFVSAGWPVARPNLRRSCRRRLARPPGKPAPDRSRLLRTRPSPTRSRR
jgi:hypothetical protein